VEDFRRDGKSVSQIRKARFGNAWIKPLKGEWTELTHARFTGSSAEWESKENIDAGLADAGWFYLATGGETRKTHPLNGVLERGPTGKAPKALPDEVTESK
jgi:hypothetical protein